MGAVVVHSIRGMHGVPYSEGQGGCMAGEGPERRVEPLSVSRLTDLVEAVGDESPTIFRRLLEIFCRDSPLHIREIQRAVAEGRAQDLVRAAHSLKSGSGNLGVDRLRDLAQLLEERGRSGSLEGLETQVEDLEQAYAEGRAALEDWVDRTFR